MSQVGRSDATPITPLRTRRNSHVNHVSETWRSPRDASINSSRGPLTIASPVTSKRAFVNGIPEHLAVQEMAFRRGQHDYNGSHDKTPPNPFAKPFDSVWAQYYKLGAAYGKAPATLSTVASPPSQGNFAWSVLINPATQDLEHPNGSVDMEWARTICIMGLKCMRELISIVCRRHNDWRKIVCDIPLPVKHAIVAFPDLCEHYEALLRDAHEALSGRLPMGY
ncbi:hypothetical protein COCMIDRAFT_101830 [Bipolaris oryzae ATCC 44560]|uniref:Uncharacterized protein n=1 Tax=Bipolaris oryzae ATCC 44560 TaxID=930090 RepID=W6YZQ0_COCMI|nr:uncharacterized protein COCMIDRAFT_101830 [Bipolaris oryzae ATCC 44560]EUC43085.1 hypothetical protein COCMIDRAFT_101830 [Bipolaris oryzae ATCC 44560]